MVLPPVKVRMLMRVRMQTLTSVAMFYMTFHSVICGYEADMDADRSILAINKWRMRIIKTGRI